MYLFLTFLYYPLNCSFHKVLSFISQVAELEEQLKIVSLQRKKAEQATADVLAILEENGYTDVSDDYDSNSDHESYSQANSGKNSIQSGRLVFLNWGFFNEMRSSNAQCWSLFIYLLVSGSGKSITWKGRRREPGLSDKIKEVRNRRHRGFESLYFSSPRHRQGRSCRQIRRSEARSVLLSLAATIVYMPIETPKLCKHCLETCADVLRNLRLKVFYLLLYSS